ncbi:MAG: HD domain-containing protein [Burkholderiales bacterium]
MDYRGNDYDVSAQFNTTDPRVVSDEVSRIYLDLYPAAPTKLLDHAFRDLTRLYRGEYPGYHPCDTAYHDVQHTLDVTLAMARLIDGYERSRVGTQPFGDSLFRLGVITALFHDMGYVRELKDQEHKNGAEYTLTHVSRGSVFLKDYLPKIGMAEMADIAAELIHFTGYETPAGKIRVPSPIYRLLGNMLGSADIIAQMADRCYLEKCRDRLYPEFVAGGLATRRNAEGMEHVVFASGEDLVIKTPTFFQSASKRLDVELGGCYSYAQQHFGGQNLYLEELQKNIRFAQAISEENDPSILKRIPPETLAE